MMKQSLFFFLLYLSSFSFSQINLETEDVKHNQIILIGKIDKLGLLMDNYSSWFANEYNNYNLDSNSIAEISKLNIKNFKIIIFMATWCGDSREQVPRFYKVLESLENKFQLSIYALDENKSCLNINVSDFNIERVPTFIFYKNDKEIGRIIETPNQSLEKDFLEIVRIGNK